MSSSLADQFGRYRIEKPLGEGGMGSVYLAHDTMLDRRVALKTLLDRETSRPELVERFRREARAAATLNHPNLCAIYDVGEIDGVHFLTMAYVEGVRLSDYQRGDTPLDPGVAASLVIKAAVGLAEAHRLGVIHRDLKPANIMMDRKGEPIIVDFGLARRDRPGEDRLTETNTFMGTPRYASPEQWKSDPKDITASTDIYSLGVILYQLLTGRAPFLGPTHANLLWQVISEPPTPPSELRPGLDPRLDAICLKALAKKPADRFASMTDFARDLKAYLGATGLGPGGVTTVSMLDSIATRVPERSSSRSRAPAIEPARPVPPTVEDVESTVREPNPKPHGSSTFGGEIVGAESPHASSRWAWAVLVGGLTLALIVAAMVVHLLRQDTGTDFVEGPTGGIPAEPSPKRDSRLSKPTDPAPGRNASGSPGIRIPGKARVTRERGGTLNVVRDSEGALTNVPLEPGQVVEVFEQSEDGGELLRIRDEKGRELGWVPRQFLVPLTDAP